MKIVHIKPDGTEESYGTIKKGDKWKVTLELEDVYAKSVGSTEFEEPHKITVKRMITLDFRNARKAQMTIHRPDLKVIECP